MEENIDYIMPKKREIEKPLEYKIEEDEFILLDMKLNRLDMKLDLIIDELNNIKNSTSEITIDVRKPFKRRTNYR